MSKDDFTKYTWDEIEALWQKRYVLLAKELGLPFDLISESRVITINAIGQDWLREEYARQSKNSGKRAISEIIAPNITKLITNPIATSAVQIIELSHYLLEAKRQAKLALALDMLRNPSQFEAGRLNMAMFYRFSQVGLLNLTLEPDIPRGKGDFFGEYEKDRYLVECSILKEDTLQRELYDQLQLSLQNAVKDKVLEVGMEIAFHKIADKNSVAETIKVIRESRNLFGKGLPPDTSEKKFHSSIATGRLFKLSKTDKRTIPDMGQWDNVFAITYGKPLEERNIYSMDLDKQPRTGMIFVKGLKIAIRKKSLYERLKAKVEAKISQTHGLPEGTKRIFIIMTENKVEDYDWDRIWDYLRPLTDKRESVSAILFVDRRASKVGGFLRYAYPQIHFINNRFNRNETHDLFPRLEKLERSDWIKSNGRIQSK